MRLRVRRGRTGTGRRLVAATVLVCSLSGCGSIKGFAFAVENRVASIFFGAVPHTLTQPTPIPAPAAVPASADQFPSQDFTFPDSQPSFHIPSSKPQACPSAPLGTPAEAAAGTNSLVPPVPGAYKFYTTYLTRNSSGAATVRTQFETRYITNVSPDSVTPSAFSSNTIHNYTFQELLPDPSIVGGHEVLSFAVKTYSDINNNAVFYEGNNDPAGGLALTGITRYAPDHSVIESWSPPPSTPVLLLDYPVVVGNNQGAAGNSNYSWDFTGADPGSQWTVEVNAIAGATRALVDACGKVVEGWPVTATVTMNKKDPTTGVPFTGPVVQTWHYVVAPEYGSLIVEMSVDGPNPSGTSASLTTYEKLASVDFGALPSPQPTP